MGSVWGTATALAEVLGSQAQGHSISTWPSEVAVCSLQGLSRKLLGCAGAGCVLTGRAGAGPH